MKYCVLIIGTAGLILQLGCTRAQNANAKSIDPAQVKVEDAPDANLITIEHPEQFKLATVETRRMNDELRVTGSVSPDVSKTVPVLSLTGGRVADIRARLGDEVKKGQVLLTISSPDVSQAFSDYAKFQADEVLARTQLERSQLLYSKGAMAQKDLQVAEDMEAKAKVDVHAAAEHIRILGGDISRPSPVVEIRAPVSGTIVEQNISGGTGVKSLDNSPNLFTIADLSSLWLLCDVYENDLSKVHLGDMADVRLNAYPDRVLRGKVSNIGRMLDPATRSAKVRLEMPNAGGLLRPNMFASVTFHSSASKQRAVIPGTAVLQLHDRTWVFVPEGAKKFRRVEIQAGASMPDSQQEVLSGLAPGDRLVANALQFSNAAENQ